MKRPPGRPPKNCIWDPTLGYVKKSDSEKQRINNEEKYKHRTRNTRLAKKQRFCNIEKQQKNNAEKQQRNNAEKQQRNKAEKKPRIIAEKQQRINAEKQQRINAEKQQRNNAEKQQRINSEKQQRINAEKKKRNNEWQREQIRWEETKPAHLNQKNYAKFRLSQLNIRTRKNWLQYARRQHPNKKTSTISPNKYATLQSLVSNAQFNVQNTPIQKPQEVEKQKSSCVIM